MVLMSVAALAVGIGVVALATPRSEPHLELQFAPTRYEDGLAKGDILGSAAAPVVIELYSDFQCPACRLFVTTQLQRLTDEFVRPGIVRIEARDIAFLGKGSFDESLELAVGAACAAEQDRYWQFHDLVFWNQGRENRGDHSTHFIGNVAERAAVDRTAWDTCVGNDAARQAVRATTSQAFAIGVSSTPTLIVNGVALAGVPDYDQLAALIRQKASEAA